MRLIKQLDEWLAKAESGFLVILLFLMVFLSFGQVILRNFLHSGLLWTDIFLRQLVLWVGFLGASLAVRERRHISVDVLPQFIPEKYRPFVDVLVNLLAGIITVFLTSGLLEVCSAGDGVSHDPLLGNSGLDFSNDFTFQFRPDFPAVFCPRV